MARCLLKEGEAGTSDKPLIVWNRTASKCVALKEQYPDKSITVASSAKEVVEKCGVTYSMLSTPEVSKTVFEANEGVLAGVSSTSCIVDCATLAESDMKRMSEAVKAKGGRFLEAPVSGSKVPAAQGMLIFLCAGDRELYNDIEGNALKAMGKATHFFSDDIGFGTRAKLVVNSLMGTMLTAFGEGLALSGAAGLDEEKMLEVFSQGVCASPLFGLKGSKMLAGDHAPNFPLRHAHKDMALASDMAKQAGVEYSVMDQAEKMLRAAREDEELNVADEDFSAVFEKIHKESSSEFSKKRRTK